MRRSIKSCIALVIVALPLQVSAALFDNIFLLGDSLSDQGNLFAATASVGGVANALPSGDHYFNGRFSNGPVYVDLLASALGVTSTPSIAGGNNFAYGGARTTYNTVETTAGGVLPPGLFPWSLNAETAAFSARNIHDPNALYIVFSGSNDVADIVSRGLNPATVIPTAVSGVLAGVQAFINAGARLVVVPNLPDLGLIPAFVGNPAASAAATALSQQFNSLLHAQLGALSGTDIVEFDTFDFFRDIVNHPANFGLTNVSTPCYSGFVAPNPAGTVCATPNQYLFWDIVHPTQVVHALLAQELLQVISAAAVPEPSTLALLLLACVVIVLTPAGRRAASARAA